ncbi:MAG: nucleotidyltransferase domain-containing protein [Thermomicrobiales bacterium]
MMRATDVLAILDCLAAAGALAWLDGGWGVDALAGEQTREHDDLDLVIAIEQLPAALATLNTLGFTVATDELPTRLVARDPADRRIDFHPVTWDSGGGGHQALPHGRTFRYPPEGFTGRGVVAGRPVACLTAEVQARCHLGYAPDEHDFHDMWLLRDHCGVTLPPPYDED